MATPRLHALLGHIEKLSAGPGEPHGTDRQLLEDFSARHDETAFTELVARHGPMVWRVCRRVLHHEQDAEDAFQATFLVLARCFGSIRKREALADWLYGVAYRTAMKAKRSMARRRNHETHLRERTPPTAASPTWDDVQTVLDEEIQRLPASFRAAFVVCVLEGKTIAAAAAELGCKEGTVASRLARARQRLQQQLSRRGIELTALLAALCVAENISKAAVPAVLAQTAVRNGLLMAAGGTAAGQISPHVAALATGVSRAMFLQKAKIAVLVLLTLGVFATGAGVLTQQLLKAEEKPPITQPRAKPRVEPAKPAEDGIEVTGRVLDPDGKPVAKARLYQPRWLKERQSATTADCDAISVGVTDAEGRFRVQLPRPSPHSRWPFQLLAAADGFGLNWVELPKDEKPDEVTLRLVKDQVVRGRLVDTEGKPVVGVTVEVRGVWSSLADLLRYFDDQYAYGKVAHPVDVFTTLNKVVHVPATDKDGRFEIAGLGAERGISAALKSPTAVMPGFIVATREDFDPKPLNSRTGARKLVGLVFGPSFEWAVLPTRSIEGTVREAGSNKPVVGARVWAGAGGVSAEGVTDTKGHYRLTGLIKADNYYVSVSPGNKNAPLLGLSTQVADGPGLETLVCNVVLKRGVQITGRVFDKATGKGVKSDVQWVLLLDKDSEKKGGGGGVKTDSEGRFSLVTVPGLGVLLAVVSGVVNKVDVNPYKTAEFDEADRKRVKVDKTPVEGNRYFDRADGRGVFLDNYNACKVVDLKEGVAPVACDLTVDPGQTRTIDLQDPDGKPLAGVTASGLGAMWSSFALLKTATCPIFAFDSERPRQLAFLHKERKLFALVTVRDDSKEPLTVRLAPTAAVSGRFLDGAGKPLADAEIFLGYSEDATEQVIGPLYWWDDSPRPHTDKEGRFRLESVFPGMKFTLGVHMDQKIFAEETKAERKPLKGGATLDLGDIRMKVRSN